MKWPAHVIVFIVSAGLPLLWVDAQDADHSTRLTQVERASCLAQGGEVLIAGLSYNEMCALPYRDGGRRCTSSSQCEGDCVYAHRNDDLDYPRRGARVRGECQSLNYPFGCSEKVERGRLQETVCTD